MSEPPRFFWGKHFCVVQPEKAEHFSIERRCLSIRTPPSFRGKSAVGSNKIPLTFSGRGYIKLFLRVWRSIPWAAGKGGKDSALLY